MVQSQQHVRAIIFRGLCMYQIVNPCAAHSLGAGSFDRVQCVHAGQFNKLKVAGHFNLTVELPLKTIVRGYSWTVMPITWRNRRAGESKLKIKEMGSRYLFICFYIWLEKYFSRGDYKRPS